MGGRCHKAHCETSYTNIYDIPLTDIDGQPRSMSEFRGQVLLIVNVATQ
jgi:glutathione peroxidase-family protein